MRYMGKYMYGLQFKLVQEIGLHTAGLVSDKNVTAKIQMDFKRQAGPTN